MAALFDMAKFDMSKVPDVSKFSAALSTMPNLPIKLSNQPICTMSNKRYPYYNLCIKDGKEVVLAPVNLLDPTQAWYKVPAGGKVNGFALVNKQTMQAMVPGGKDLPVRLISVPLRSDGTMNPSFLKQSGGGIMWTKEGISGYADTVRVYNNPCLGLDAEDERDAAGDACSAIRTCNCNDEENQLWDLTPWLK